MVLGLARMGERERERGQVPSDGSVQCKWKKNRETSTHSYRQSTPQCLTPPDENAGKKILWQCKHEALKVARDEAPAGTVASCREEPSEDVTDEGRSGDVACTNVKGFRRRGMSRGGLLSMVGWACMSSVPRTRAACVAFCIRIFFQVLWGAGWAFRSRRN